jgi:hypothetical protein
MHARTFPGLCKLSKLPHLSPCLKHSQGQLNAPTRELPQRLGRISYADTFHPGFSYRVSPVFHTRSQTSRQLQRTMILYFVRRLRGTVDHNSKGLACFIASRTVKEGSQLSQKGDRHEKGDFPSVWWCPCGAPQTSRAISNSGSHVSLATCDWGDHLPLPSHQPCRNWSVELSWRLKNSGSNRRAAANSMRLQLREALVG